MLQLPDTCLLLDALLLGVTDEVYLIDTSTMQLSYVSESVLKDTGLDLEALNQQSLDHLLGVSLQTLQAHIESHRHHSYFVELSQETAPVIGNIKHNQLRVMLMPSGDQEFVLIIKNDFSAIAASACFTCKGNFEKKLSDAESRFQVMVSNTPSVVFQFQLDSEGEVKFIYVNEGCQALLGIDAEELKNDSGLLYAMMNGRDRSNLRKQLEESIVKLSQLNWEGKVWIDGWQDNKWIDMRAAPRVLSNGVVQWEGMMTNITQSKNEKHVIERSRRELGELTAHMHTIKEQERTKIAREIHDDLGGNLTAIKMGLSTIIKRIGAGQAVSIEQVKSLDNILDSTFEAVHKISSDLRPNVLDLGLVEALAWQSKEFEKQVGITCTFTTNQAEISVSTDQATTLFRICQESMSNIAKHAKATEVSVDLNAGAHEVVMTITDNGVGVKASDMLKINSFGLRGMRERVTALHGSFDIAKANIQGTTITVRLPF